MRVSRRSLFFSMGNFYIGNVLEFHGRSTDV